MSSVTQDEVEAVVAPVLHHANPWPSLSVFVIVYAAFFAWILGVPWWGALIAGTACLLPVWWWNSTRLRLKMQEDSHKQLRSHLLRSTSLDESEKRRLLKSAVKHQYNAIRAKSRQFVFLTVGFVGSYGLALAMIVWSPTIAETLSFIGVRKEALQTVGAFVWGFGIYVIPFVLYRFASSMNADAKAFTTLTDLILTVERYPRGRFSPAVRRQLIRSLENVARYVSVFLAKQSAGWQVPWRDRFTRAWLRSQAADVAGGIRALKRCVTLPGNATRDELLMSLRDALMWIGEEDWRSLPRAEGEEASPSAIRWSIGLKVGVAVLAIAGIVAVSITKMIDDDQAKAGLIGVFTGVAFWAFRSSPSPATPVIPDA